MNDELSSVVSVFHSSLAASENSSFVPVAALIISLSAAADFIDKAKTPLVVV
jgi:hypothetical protein